MAGTSMGKPVMLLRVRFRCLGSRSKADGEAAPPSHAEEATAEAPAAEFHVKSPARLARSLCRQLHLS